MRLLALVSLLAVAADVPPPALAVDATCVDYADSHTLVRKDVLAQLNADHKNLPLCEEGLKQAQVDLTQAQADLLALKKAAEEQQVAIAKLKAQKEILERHITKLEGLTCPEPTVGDQIAQTWESVDGSVGMAAGYALGTGMCIGMAWVFNQPDFTR